MTAANPGFDDIEVPTFKQSMKIVKLKMAVITCFLPTDTLNLERERKNRDPTANLTQVITIGETSAETILVNG
ncbi:hypothetical protein Mcup_1004 [Metallosphaera cuprina Ar-4]|uniref:Uncharacterized protein n=1 Tax=Metallosphaera cuprina (strain Ar-4) TaxID=1006006 RepID=F4G2R1_METCR|nr:hypothetical protein Mcup_1004 [Metallosphaera cuprina Ar-4]